VFVWLPSNWGSLLAKSIFKTRKNYSMHIFADAIMNSIIVMLIALRRLLLLRRVFEKPLLRVNILKHSKAPKNSFLSPVFAVLWGNLLRDCQKCAQTPYKSANRSLIGKANEIL
jgi:hypothetical protein